MKYGWKFFASVLPALALLCCSRAPQAPPAFGPPEVATLTVVRQRVTLTTELPGRTAPYLIAEIRPQVSGLLLKRLFTEGSDVKAGELLYQIDPAPFEAALSNAQAALARSEASLPAARAREERLRKALADKAVSQQDYDDAAAALRQAEADVQYWRAAVETARINLGYTKITAPISGRIGRSSVTDGAIVTAYQPVPLATIQQLDPIYVDVPQSTTELLRLQKRLASGVLKTDADMHKVQLILEDGSKYPLEGTLQFRDVTVDPTTGTVTLRMVFPNPNCVLLPHMFVRAVLKEGTVENAILIPQPAVVRDPKGNPMVMLVNAEGKVEPRPVLLEREVGDKWLVAAGLAPGDRIIVEGLLRVRPGIPVKEVPMPVVGASPR
ncbi:MAG: efflux RND transporter periplasmic adaptor subunit [Verrucomicrobiae bacterium]|nr:efflux RND transporter periplasmic adaptor subunit [Verrucomicrobiae bacterium]